MDECTRTYCPLLAPAALRSVPPLKGLWEPCAAILCYRTSVPAGHRNERGFRRSGCRWRNEAHHTCCPCGGRQPFPESKFLCRRILVMAGTHHSAKRGSVERNLQNHPHPQPPAVPCPLLPVRWTFTFSAKERDAETGFSVTSLRSVSSSSLSKGQTSLSLHSLIRRFGSRYYSSDLSIWLSVDPQASKYPSLSPYAYCADNPIKLVDPKGEEVWSTYLEAHWCANQIAIGNKGPVITRTSLRSNPRYNPLFPISPCNSPIEVGEFEIQTGWARTTNKYGL